MPRLPLALLLDHEFRLWRRRFTSATSPAKPWYLTPFVLVLVGFYIVVQALDFAIMWSTHARGPQPQFTQLVEVDLLIFAVLIFVTITELSFVVARAYSPGEADLLYAAPIPPQLIFASRLIRGAIGAAPTWLLLISPVVNGYILFDGFRYASIYVTAFLIFGLAHIIANLLLLGLYGLLGARRTKTAGNLLAALALISFIVCSQFARFSFGAHIAAGLYRALAAYAFTPQSWCLLPARALLGAAPDTLLLALFAVLLLGLTVLAFSQPYERMMLDCGQAHEGQARRRHGAAPLPVRGLRPTLLRKEFAAMRRNPTLWMQLLSSTAYIIPAAMSIGRGMFTGDHFDPAMLTAMLAFLSVTASSPVMQLVFLNEGAPELMATAPITRSFDLGCKWQISALFTLGFLSLPLVLVAFLSPLAGLAGLLFCIVGVACHAIVYVSYVDHAVPYRNSKKMHLPFGAGMLTILLALTMAAIAFTLMRHTLLTLVPMAVLIITLGALLPTRQKRRRVLGIFAV